MQVRERHHHGASTSSSSLPCGRLRSFSRACGFSYVLGHPILLGLFLLALVATTLAARQVAEFRRDGLELRDGGGAAARFVSGSMARFRLKSSKDQPRSNIAREQTTEEEEEKKKKIAIQEKNKRESLENIYVLIERIRVWLHPFTSKYAKKMEIPPLALRERACGRFWSSIRTKTYLAGCPNNPESLDPCEEFLTLEDAKRECVRLGSSCGGITRESGSYQVRAGQKPQPQEGESADSWIYLRDPCVEDVEPRKSTAEGIWDAFHVAVDAALEDDELGLRLPLGPTREDDTIFVSIAAYRDTTCSHTLRLAFERAARPERISVGIVQQNCQSQTQCYTGTGWANTRRWVSRPGPDPDCAEAFCSSTLGKPHCEAGRVRILRLDEIDSLGPFFTRFVNSRLWRGENFYLQIDAHTDFRSSWDISMVAQMRATPTYPHSVISNYPPGGDPKHSKPWVASDPAVRDPTPSALCACSFETAGMGRYTIRLGESSRRITTKKDIPRKTCFVAAGFFIAHGSIVDNVGFDPFMPFLFMGEEIALSLRFWTHGYELYAPSVDVLKHEYVRKEAPKFWESVGEIFSHSNIHNELTDVVIQRVQYLAKFPDADVPSKVVPDSLLIRLNEMGIGAKRSEKDFEKEMGLNYGKREQRPPHWCTSPS